MVIRIGWNEAQVAYMVEMATKHHDTVIMYTKNLMEIIKLIKLMKTHYRIKISFHQTMPPQVQTGILEGIRTYITL